MKEWLRDTRVSLVMIKEKVDGRRRLRPCYDGYKMEERIKGMIEGSGVQAPSCGIHRIVAESKAYQEL